MKKTGSNALIPNPALKQLDVLIGEWKSEGTHPLVAGEKLKGHSSFKWIEGGAFLAWHSQVDKEGFPHGVAIFGSDNDQGEYFMLYFDERKVSRKYNVAIEGNTIKWWRNAPGFSQRYSWMVSKDRNTLVGKGEICKDDKNWEPDLDLTYTRVK